MGPHKLHELRLDGCHHEDTADTNGKSAGRRERFIRLSLSSAQLCSQNACKGQVQKTLPIATMPTCYLMTSKYEQLFFSSLTFWETPTLSPTSFRGASAKIDFPLAGTSKHVVSTDLSTMISWQAQGVSVMLQASANSVASVTRGCQELSQERLRASRFCKTFRMLPHAQ